MKNGEWKEIFGLSNMGDDEERVFAMMSSDNVLTVAYSAYGGVSTVELTGVHDCYTPDNAPLDSSAMFDSVIAECGTDWSVAILATTDAGTVIIVTDECSDVKVINAGCTNEKQVDNPTPVSVVSTDEYDADECEELDEELLRLLNLI